MKVCIVGNSHIASLKFARDALAGNHMEISFFGAPNTFFIKLEFVGGLLVGPQEIESKLLRVSDGMLKALDPRDFDAILFHGGDFALHLLVASIHKVVSRHDAHFSEAFLDRGIGTWLEQRTLFQWACMARQVSPGTRILLSPRPCPAVEVLEQRPGWAWDHMSVEFRQGVWRRCVEFSRERGIELLLQPEETLSDSQYTDPAFTISSRRLLDSSNAHEPSDVAHMNEKYGAAVLAALEERLMGESHARPQVSPA